MQILLRQLADFIVDVLSAVAAVPAGLLPRRHWPALKAWLPIRRFALASAIMTFGLAAAIGIPGFLRLAERNADIAADASLQVAGWQPSEVRPSITSERVAVSMWGASYLSLFTFLFLTPAGWVTTYLGATGMARAVLAVVDDAHGDPVLTGLDTLILRARRGAAERRRLLERERQEGPETPDRLVTGSAAGINNAEIVIVASRRKPGWDPGAFIITADKWYRLGTPVERQLPGGLRTLYPLTEIQDHEVLRRGVPYELPAGPGIPSSAKL